jgi:putative mRNA 3-end processing factor
MMSELLCKTAAGIYCPAGDFYVDPLRVVERAVITHGHSDHARPGHKTVLTTDANRDLMRVRMGNRAGGSFECPRYGETVRVGDAAVTLLPAGHVLGSAQVVIEVDGQRAVVTGDYKRRPDPTCLPFEPVTCDLFVTEATFALPVYRHPPVDREIGRLLASIAANSDRCHLIAAYSLGKAQRLIRLLRNAGFDLPIYAHDAVLAINEVYEAHDVTLGDVRPLDAVDDFSGEVVFAPPSAGRLPSLRAAWPLNVGASGWLGIKKFRQGRAGELPLVISDHADWDELTATLDEVAAPEVWIQYGPEAALRRHLAA